jgi:hypothetical protein
MSPKKRAVLENVYRPMEMNFGEKSWCRDQEKKEEFRRPTQITPVKILPVTPVKIPAAAGKAHEEPSKTVGPAGDSLYQSQREEKKLMVDSEASSTSSEKGEISIMEEGEFSDDDNDDDMNGLQDNSGKKDDWCYLCRPTEFFFLLLVTAPTLLSKVHLHWSVYIF